MGKYFITPKQLRSAFGGNDTPRIIDVRKRDAFDGDDKMIPGAIWRNHLSVTDWSAEFTDHRDVVIYCVRGHQVSQSAAASLRAAGFDARILQGGIEAWREAGMPVLSKSRLPISFADRPSRWVTRRRPKIDRIACPWFIKRFLDPEAEILFVEPDQVLAVAREIGGISFDIDGAEITHEGDLCSFDILLRRSEIEDPALHDMATIIRGADTARLDLAPEAAGLLALSVGVSALAGEDDQMALQRGLPLYDALYAWRQKAPNESHNWPAGSRS